MEVQISLPRPAELVVRNGRKFSDKAYLDFWDANPDLRLERTAEGEIVIVPPVGYESDNQNAEVISQLHAWAKKDGRGRASGATAQFFLPDGSALSPDAAWVSYAALSSLLPEELRRFPHLAPEFVIEVMSPTDRLAAAKRKMEQWIANGVQLGWLIDGDHETVYVYQPNRPVQTRKGILKLAGKGPVKGFTLQLRTIWQGLK